MDEIKKNLKNQPEQKTKEVKKKFEVDIVFLMKNGFKIPKIAEKLNISMPRLQYYLSSLKRKGIVKKIGYGTWEIDNLKEVKISTKDTINQPEHFFTKKEVRGHAFIWKVRVPEKLKKINWNEYFTKKGIPFKEVGLKHTPRVLVEKNKVWFGKKHLIIFELESFFAINSIESRKLAIFKLLSILDRIEKKIDLSLKPYEFTPRREHYALIKNNLAIQCNKEGTKIRVSDKKGLWFVVDNSYNLDEAETLGKEEAALKDNLGVQRYFNEHKETGFNVTPKFILTSFAQSSEVINGMLQNANLYNANIVSHVKAIQELGEGVKKNNEIMEKILKFMGEKEK